MNEKTTQIKKIDAKNYVCSTWTENKLTVNLLPTILFFETFEAKT